MREIKFRCWSETRKEMRYDILNIGNFDNKWWKIMQFTGLKDKNDKEIYEGDIFNCIYKNDGCKHKLLVVWYKDSACFKMKSYGECDQPNVTQTFSDMERQEVIGNIYENPEFVSLAVNDPEGDEPK